MSVRVPLLLILTAAALAVPVYAAAQIEPGPPGPYAFDLRGSMVGVPNAGEFYPTLPSAAAVPGRAFGIDLGGHAMLGRVGGGRLGIGANMVMARGKVGPPDVLARVTTVAPQVSLNFGTADGWSHVSAGYGAGSLGTSAPGETGEETAGTGVVGVLNFGGGARWFVGPHLATSFDVRFHRFAASSGRGTPSTMRLALSVGVSVR